METLLNWLSQYSTPIVVLLALGAAVIYVLKNVMENAISAEFDRQSKGIELLLERRARFEEKILLDQYALATELQVKIIGIATDLNRYWKNKEIPVENLFKGVEVPRLTKVYEQLSTNRYLLRNDLYEVLLKWVNLVMELANEIKTFVNEEGSSKSKELRRIEHEYIQLQNEFHRLMKDAFDID